MDRIATNTMKRARATRLADDCFSTAEAGRDGDDPLAVEAALARILARLHKVTGIETVALDGALDRVLGEDVVAELDIPPHDNAAVDGFALRFDDLRTGRDTSLTITGRVAAGHPSAHPLGPGEAMRIFTGAPLPAGADSIFMAEDCRVEEDAVIVPPGGRRGMNRRLAGEDVRRGAVVLEAGRRLGPAELGLAASLGRTSLRVRRRLRVAVLSTGDEVVEPGTPRTPGLIYDANRFTVKALLQRLGCAVTDVGILPDDYGRTVNALRAAAAAHDAIVTSGGVSDGEEDHVRQALAQHGRIEVWRLAVKPGRPVALGILDGCALIGLPGNPVAAVVAFLTLARPILLTLAGTSPGPPATFPVSAGFAYAKKPGRREFLRVRLAPSGRAGEYPQALPAGPGGSGVLSSLAAADGLLVLAESAEGLAEGALVDYLPFSEVMR